MQAHQLGPGAAWFPPEEQAQNTLAPSSNLSDSTGLDREPASHSEKQLDAYRRLSAETDTKLCKLLGKDPSQIQVTPFNAAPPPSPAPAALAKTPQNLLPAPARAIADVVANGDFGDTLQGQQLVDSFQQVIANSPQGCKAANQLV